MVKARLSEAEWKKIKSESGIEEKNGEAGRAHLDDEKVEPVAMPSKSPTKLGTMQPSSGGKPAGAVTEWKSHEGYDASTSEFEKEHPTLAKAVDIGKKVVGVINEKTAGYVKDTEDVNKKLKELEMNKEDEDEERDNKLKKKSKKKSKKDEPDFDLDNEDDEDITVLHKSTSKQKILPGDYKSAYGGREGIFGSSKYKPAYTSTLGSDDYQPAYKQKVRGGVVEETISKKPTTKSPVEEMPPAESNAPAPRVNRFNMQNWQSVGFPNTLPQSARGSLFRPASPPVVVPIVRQPYQPHQPMPVVINPRAQMPVQTPTPPARRPMMSSPMPRIGLNINTAPQIMKPKTTITPPRAPSHIVQKTAPAPAPITFMGVTLGEKKKQEPKPITRMVEGYKHVPLVVMNGIYPDASYNPSKDSITKKSIIPKIHATVSPHDFTMFGMRVKNKKN